MSDILIPLGNSSDDGDVIFGKNSDHLSDEQHIRREIDFQISQFYMVSLRLKKLNSFEIFIKN